MLPKREVVAFWDKPSFEDQVKLIAGSVPWEVSEQNAPSHRRLIETTLVHEHLQDIKGRKPVVLEVGCGVGRLLKHFWMGGYDVIGIDISPQMIKKAKQYLGDTIANPMLLVTRGNNLPLKQSSCVDFVYSFLVFQHIQTAAEVRAYIRESLRVLRPGGYLRVQTYCGDPQPETQFGGFHGRFYPTLDAFAAEFSVWPGATVVEQSEGEGHEKWLWVTVRKD